MLVWARKSAGLEPSILARKVGVTPDRLDAWERGDAHPTVKQLRRFGRACKRPLAVFYLPEPPKDFSVMHDFRRTVDGMPLQLSPELLFEIRRAQQRRELCLDLHELIGEEPTAFSLRCSRGEDPERVGLRFREALGITYEDQAGWRTWRQAFNRWRSMLEDAGVLVFQARGVAVSEARAFSIADVPQPALVVNIKDSLAGRIFSMLHELAHIALRTSGLCDLSEDGGSSPEDRRVEVFCNAVAGATVVPRARLLQDALVVRKGHTADWTEGDLRVIAARYRTSEEVVLRRLVVCGRAPATLYEARRQQFLERYRQLRERRPRGFAPPHQMALSAAGKPFVRLVLNSYHQDRITASDVADILEVRLKHLDKIQAEVFGLFRE